MLGREAAKYQFHSLRFDPSWDLTHNLSHLEVSMLTSTPPIRFKLYVKEKSTNIDIKKILASTNRCSLDFESFLRTFITSKLGIKFQHHKVWVSTGRCYPCFLLNITTPLRSKLTNQIVPYFQPMIACFAYCIKG